MDRLEGFILPIPEKCISNRLQARRATAFLVNHANSSLLQELEATQTLLHPARYGDREVTMY